MTGTKIFDLIVRDTGINKEHLRITSGYKEINPNNQTYKFNNEESLLIKLRLLGGSALSEGITKMTDDSTVDNWDLLLQDQ